MTKLNQTMNLENGTEITLTKEGNDYLITSENETLYTGTLLACRAYASARLEGKDDEEAKEAAAKALAKKYSPPTESQKAHALGMTIREYRAHRQSLRAEATSQQTEEPSEEAQKAMESARQNGLDLSMDMMMNIRVDLKTGEVIRMEDTRTEEEKERELKLWASLWSQDGATVKKSAAAA